MSVVKRYNPNKFYFSDRIVEKVNTIFDNDFTIVEAPTGFGKTTSVKNALNESVDLVVWITAENEDKEQFFLSFCDSIENIDDEIGKKLKSMGCPNGPEEIQKICNCIEEIELKENYIFVFDNFQYVSDSGLGDMAYKITESLSGKIKIVILTQNVKSANLIDMIFDKKINYIGKTDLEFNFDEIKYYYKECGIKLSEQEAEYLTKYTEGWISALYLQMLHYIANNEFEADSGIDKLVCKAIWDKITVEEQDFLISMSIYDSFSLKQAMFVGAEDFNQDEIRKILNSNSFIRYESKERKYYIHAILRYFLQSEFEKFDTIVQKNVYEKAAKWYEENENYYQAMLYFYEIGKYDDIYEMKLSLDDLIPCLTRANREMFIKIISGASVEVKEENFATSIALAFALFIYNEKDFFNNECELIEDLIKDSDYLRNREREKLLGEIRFFKSFKDYNDLEKMCDSFEEAYEHMQSPSSIYSGKFSLIFKTPSVLGCFFRTPGKVLEELECLERTMICYYKITSGNSKGLEAVMRAEILYNQGMFEASETLCQKSLYMAETRGQTNVYIATMFLMARLACFEGDYDNLKHIIKSIGKKLETTGERDKLVMADLSVGFVYAMIDKINGIPEWLKDEKDMETKCTVLSLSIGNVIYGKFLLENEEYSKFLGISGQMLGASKVYGNVFFQIYLYIYISYANYMLGNKAKAVKFLDEALNIASKDNFVMPFVENYKYIDAVMDIENKTSAYNEFFDRINNIYKRSEKKFKGIKNSYREDVDFGLTKRELQIAKLAAKRMTNKEIADQLFLAVGTVKSNLKTIFAKLNIKSRAELKDFFGE